MNIYELTALIMV